MISYIITAMCLLSLCVLLTKPKLLKFLKRPTRFKAFWICLFVYGLILQIWHFTPAGKKENEEFKANNPPQQIYYPASDTTKNYTFPWLGF
jgi:hypothetical protein